MTDLTEHIVNYMDIVDIRVKLNNDSLNYDNLGIVLNSNRFNLCRVLYSTYKIQPKPYKAFYSKTSFDKNKITLIKYLVEYVYLQSKELGKKDISIRDNLHKTIQFIDYANVNNIPYLNNINQAQEAYLSYTKHLRESIRNGDLIVRVQLNTIQGVKND